MGGVKQEREGVKGESGYLGAGVGWGCLGRKLRSFEQNLRAQRPSRSLKSALVSFLLPGTVLGGRGMGGAVQWEKGREVSSLQIRGPASPSPVFWALRGRRFAPETLSMPRVSLEGEVPPKMHILILAQLHTSHTMDGRTSSL